MALIAAFPSGVYYGAVFPVSVLAASLVGSLALVERRRWAGAGLLGAIGSAAYPSGVAVVAVAVALLFDPRLGPRRERVGPAVLVGVPPVLAHLAVHAEMWRTVGRWDAWFQVQGAYGHEPTTPLTAIAIQLGRIGEGVESAIGIQTVLVMALVAFTVATAIERRAELGPGERASVALVGAMWCVPLTLGAALSLWRAESLLVPVAILLSRLPARVLVALVAVAIPTSVATSYLFFDGVLI